MYGIAINGANNVLFLKTYWSFFIFRENWWAIFISLLMNL